MENYTSRMPDFSLQRFEALCGKKVHLVTRQMLEEENGKLILEAAKIGKAVFLGSRRPLHRHNPCHIADRRGKTGNKNPYSPRHIDHVRNSKPLRIAQLQVRKNRYRTLSRELFGNTLQSHRPKQTNWFAHPLPFRFEGERKPFTYPSTKL